MKRAFLTIAVAAALACASAVNAAPILVYDAATGIGGAGEVTDSSGAGNDGTAIGGVTVAVDGPNAGDSSYSFDGTGADNASRTRITTNAIDLLDNAAVVAAGGFTMDAWIRTDGQGLGGSASVIDYAGTERIQFDNTGAITFRISDGGAQAISSVNVTDNEWHRVNAQFIVTDGSDLANVLGNLRITVDGISEPLVAGTLTGFGDSLNRPIGVGGHPIGFAGDVYAGLINDPTVSLGIVPRAWHLGAGLLRHCWFSQRRPSSPLSLKK